ncbi:MAG TPA: transposase [Thermomicrobiales bacterium]|nr:transposase [Thermomicrobiales bacterium]
MVSHVVHVLFTIHRRTFARQAANLWLVKERLWQGIAAQAPHDPHVALIDSFPVPVCRFARAKRCRLFGGVAAFGYDEAARQTLSGFRRHVRLAWPSVIADLVLAPANVSEPEVARALAAEMTGYLIGYRNYWSPLLTEDVAAHGICLLAPYRVTSRDPDPARSRFLSPIRYRIETVFGQLVDRCHAKRVWARDPWQLASRFLRKALSHTIALLLNARAGNPPRQFARLLTGKTCTRGYPMSRRGLLRGLRRHQAQARGDEGSFVVAHVGRVRFAGMDFIFHLPSLPST